MTRSFFMQPGSNLILNLLALSRAGLIHVAREIMLVVVVVVGRKFFFLFVSSVQRRIVSSGLKDLQRVGCILSCGLPHREKTFLPVPNFRGIFPL
jgi:hypothetical protein